MEVINFEDAKARKQSKVRRQSKSRNQSKVRKQTITKHSPATDDRIAEMQRQYREYAQFCNQWYEDHVIGQDKDGRWIYKDL